MSLSENLITAAKSGNTKEVRRLLSKGALFTKDQYGNTALHEAAWNGNSDIVKILLTGFCFVDSINNTGFTPLHLASQNGHAKVVKTLLKWKANPSLVNQHGETALHLVAKYNHANVISSFAAHKVCLDLRGKEGNTALHIAAKLGNVETAKAMLSAGAHPAISNDRSLRPLNYAETGGYPALAKLINTAMQKYKPKHRNPSNGMSPRAPPASPGSPYTTGYSLSQPEDYPCSLSQPLGEASPAHVHGIKPRTQRSKSAKTSKDVRSSANKQTSKKLIKTEKEDKLTGSLSPAPYKYFSSQDELDSSGLYPDSKEGYHRSISPAHRQATIDQMLTEIETEYMGPGYKYKPLISSLYVDSNNYSHPRPVNSAKTYFQSTRNGDVTKENYDILTAPGSDDEYDYPNPNNTNSSNSNNSSLQKSNQSRVPNEHSHYQSPRQTRKLPSPPASPLPITTTTGNFKNHTYEPLKPKEDVDTYVYMAPLSDYPELLQPESTQHARSSLSPKTSDSQSLLSESGSELSAGGSVGGSKSGKKVAAVRDSPVEADRLHEPNAVLEPVKGILITQTTNEAEKSQLEDYLQKELETIRQAFQIRLNQLEKRYQRQLELEKHKHILSPLLPQQVHPNPSQRREQAKLKRNSWHSCMPTEQDFEIPDKSESVLNGDVPSGSDIYEHDPSLVNELPESLRGLHHKMQDNSNKPTEDEFSDYEDMSAECTVDKDSQELIHQKVSDYRDRMLHHFKEKSEAQIAAIEQEYQSQINEVQRKCEDNASEEVVQLKGRIRNLEEQLEVQTTLV